MPVENEWKYVLKVPDLGRYMMTLRGVMLGQRFEIMQGYLDDHSRIRKMVPLNGSPIWYFTHKRRVGSDLIEIETEISESDYERLWTLVRPGLDVIDKTRIKVKVADDMWEIDFIKDIDTGQLLMIMAEIELPEDNKLGPEFIPPFINDHIIWRVRQDDLRFTNRQLANVAETRRLMETLT